MASSILKSGLPGTDYYAPDFRLEVEGAQLDPITHGDVLELKVVMDMDNMASFDFTISNWDDRTVSFKYSDSDTFSVWIGRVSAVLKKIVSSRYRNVSAPIAYCAVSMRRVDSEYG